VNEFIKDSASFSTTSEQFESLHRRWCRLIQDQLTRRGIEASYGRVAKLLAVYLKVMIVIAGSEKTLLAQAIHPPIDRQLLQTLAKVKHISRLRYISYTELGSEEYYDLVSDLRQLLEHGQPFWMLEEHWPVTDD